MNPKAGDQPLVVYIIAGEASGDFLGAKLMQSLKRQAGRPVQFHGVGGNKMEAEGLTSRFPYHELSMMGFVEILPYAFNLMARIDITVDDIRTRKPDVVITIDSPGFCFRVVKKLRSERLDCKFIHYVAPTVWAYKPERAEKCAALFDHMIVLLPFEPPYFTRVGLGCTFVGHPVVAETLSGDGNTFREKYEIPVDKPLFCILPGSRKGEVERHMPIFGRAVTLLARRFHDPAMAVVVPRHVVNFVTEHFKGCPFRTVITSEEADKYNAMAAANLAIVKSGTVALEVAKNKTPMVVSYRVNPLSAWMVKRMSLTRYVNLINILLKRQAIPELLQEHCTPFMIAQAAEHILSNPNVQQSQIDATSEALARLVPEDDRLPSDIAASTILHILSAR